MSPTSKLESLPWDVIERAINEEVKWLKEVILESPYKSGDDVCKDFIYRRMAILIVSGKIEATDIKSAISLWGKEIISSANKPHGKAWHAKMMKLVMSHFKSLGFDVVIEPNLNMGRGDLGIYKKGKRDLFIEVGTISLPKLLFNLESMESSNFLLVLDLNHAVEFSVIKAGFKSKAI